MKTLVTKILLAEDNANDVELTLSALKKHNLANRVEVVRDGAEALDYLYAKGRFKGREPGNPVLVLLDLKLPKIDGIEVLRTIKGDEKLKKMPVVMLTSSHEEKDIVESYQLGVNAYVVKPVDFDEFFKSVEQLGVFWAYLNEPPAQSIKNTRG